MNLIEEAANVNDIALTCSSYNHTRSSVNDSFMQRGQRVRKNGVNGENSCDALMNDVLLGSVAPVHADLRSFSHDSVSSPFQVYLHKFVS